MSRRGNGTGNHAAEAAAPASGTSVGRMMRLIWSGEFRSGERPACMQKIFSSTMAANGSTLKTCRQTGGGRSRVGQRMRATTLAGVAVARADLLELLPHLDVVSSLALVVETCTGTDESVGNRADV